MRYAPELSIGAKRATVLAILMKNGEIATSESRLDSTAHEVFHAIRRKQKDQWEREFGDTHGRRSTWSVIPKASSAAARVTAWTARQNLLPAQTSER